MTITIFVLFVLYTLACIADGPDVKPLWKKWLGGKLERMANKYYPIQYIQRPMPEIDNPFVRQPIRITPVETKLFKSDIMFKTYDFMVPDHIVALAEKVELTKRNALFSNGLKYGISNALMEIGRTALCRGFVKCELMTDRYDSIILHSEMRITEPERSFYKEPYVLFENSKIELRNPGPLIDMGLINEEQIQF